MKKDLTDMDYMDNIDPDNLENYNPDDVRIAFS